MRRALGDGGPHFRQHLGARRRLVRRHADDGEVVGFIDAIPSPDLTPAETALKAEEDLSFQEFKEDFDRFLGQENPVRMLFRQFCKGISRPKAFASRLKLRVLVIRNIQRRLQRRMRQFLGSKNSRG